MRDTLRAELLNIPNMLTLSRIVGIPVVMLCIWQGDPRDCVMAAWIYSALGPGIENGSPPPSGFTSIFAA